MNWARARCRRATGPRITTKRAPESLAPVSKSRPRRRADVDVVLGGEGELARRAPAAFLFVLVRGAPHRHRLVRQVRDQRDEFLQLRLHRRILGLHLLELVAGLSRLCQQLRRELVVLLRLGLPDLLGQRVALRLQLLGGGLDPLPRVLEPLEPRDVELVAARRQALRDATDVRPEQLDVDHVRFPRASSFSRRSSASFSRILSSSPRSVGLYHSTAGMPSGK